MRTNLKKKKNPNYLGLSLYNKNAAKDEDSDDPKSPWSPPEVTITGSSRRFSSARRTDEASSEQRRPHHR
eukprot:m.171562 g.171562  ORF g.171562 m.171562 type:complete len:70 (+) comp39058_c0_seq11:7-216(+)